MSDTTPTVVIFRLFHGEVLAIMPYEMATPDPAYCMSYAHVGQHGACAPVGVIADSTPATPAQYAPLLAELEGLGYRVEVRKRYNLHAEEVRRVQLAEVR